MPSATGMSNATTAEWLMASVRRMPIAPTSATTCTGVAAHRLTVSPASHADAPAVERRAERDRPAVHEQHAPVDEGLDVRPLEQPEDEDRDHSRERDRGEPRLLAAHD